MKEAGSDATRHVIDIGNCNVHIKGIHIDFYYTAPPLTQFTRSRSVIVYTKFKELDCISILHLIGDKAPLTAHNSMTLHANLVKHLDKHFGQSNP